MTVDPNAPVYSEKTIDIQAAPETVWRILSNIDEWRAWQPNVSESKLQGNLTASSTINWKCDGSKRNSIIDEVETTSKLAMSWKGLGMNAAHRWDLERVHTEEATVTRITAKQSRSGWLVGFTKKKHETQVEQAVDTWLKKLKERSETQVERGGLADQVVETE